MNHLNFLDQKASAQKVSFELTYLTVMLILAGFVIFSASFFMWQRHKITTLENAVATANQELDPLRSKAAILQSKDTDQKQPLDVLNHPIEWAPVVASVTRAIPEAVSITRIAGELPKERHLLIDGQTPYLQNIADTKANLLATKMCADVNVLSLSQSPDEGGNDLIYFQVECALP